MELYKYQKDFRDVLWPGMGVYGRKGLFDDPGLGKSAQFLSVMETPCLLAVPDNAFGVWANEGEQAQPPLWRPDLRVVQVRSAKDVEAALMADFVVTNHHAIRVRTDKAGPTKGQKRAVQDWMAPLLRRKYRMFGIDEVQKMRNRKTAWTEGATLLARKAELFLPMTGSPTCNGIADLWPVLHMIDPKKFSSFWKFVQKHANAREGQFGWEYDREATDPELLKADLADWIVRRSLEDEEIEKQLPPLIEIPVIVEMTAEQKRLTNETIKWGAAKINDEDWLVSPAALEVETRLQQIAIDPRLVNSTYPGSKILEIANWLSECDRSVVVFSKWEGPLQLLREQLSQFDCAMVIGKKAVTEVQRFNTNRDVQFALCTLDAGGTVHTMTKASHIIFIDRSWNPETNRQAILRVRRNGQKASRVVVFNYKSADSVENKVFDRIDYKNEINEMVRERMEESTNEQLIN